MTRRVLTALGSATAVGACLLLGPTPQARADICSGTNCVHFGPNGSISATSGTGANTKTASVTVLSNGMICAIAMANGMTEKSSGCS
jgi:hypothetical protein